MHTSAKFAMCENVVRVPNAVDCDVPDSLFLCPILIALSARALCQ